MNLFRSLTSGRDGVRHLTASDYVTVNGLRYPLAGMTQTLSGRQQDIPADFEGLVQYAYRSNGIVFACMTARMLLFSEARFQFRRYQDGRPGELFGTPALELIERPWRNGSTRDLLAWAIQSADLSGNTFAARRPGPRVGRLRSDWVTLVMGSDQDPDIQLGDLDAEVLGLIYHPGGRGSGRPPEILLASEFAHFYPIPDPLAPWRGMTWLEPVLREIAGDSAATDHKLRFFEAGATPNMIVSLDPAITTTAWKEWVEKFEEKYGGFRNAYKTMFLGAGAKAEVVGANFQQMDFKITQGAGETRIAAAAGVPPIIVGLSEGLQSATYSNYGQAKRRFGDMTMRPLWGNIANSLEAIIDVPPGAELTYDDRDIAALREDIADRANVQSTQAAAIRQLVDAGFKPDSVVAAITGEDLAKLVHTDLYSVQLQPPGTVAEEKPAPAPAPKALPEAASADARSLPDYWFVRQLEARAVPWWERLSVRHLPGKHDQKTHAGGGGALGGEGDGGTGTKDDPIRTGDVVVAQKALAEGKYVELRSERQVSTLVDRLAADIRSAKEKGETRDYDLCRVSVPRTNLFCSQSKGIPRAQMPQLKGRPVPGSPADALPKNAKGEADLSAAFVEHLRAKGMSVSDGEVDAKYLKASQNQLDGVKVVGMAQAIREGKIPAEAIFVTSDDYIVDGHHRWAANVAVEYQTGAPVNMPVRVIDADIITVLSEANAFATEMGLPQQGYGARSASIAGCTSCGESDLVLELDERHLPGQHFQGDHAGKGAGGNDYGGLAKAALDGGFSVTIHGDAPRSGYMVSPYKGAERQYRAATFQPRDVKAYRDSHRELLARPDHYVGGWRDGDTIYLDVSIHADERSAAVAVAKEHNQLAIYELDTGTVIPTAEAA